MKLIIQEQLSNPIMTYFLCIDDKRPIPTKVGYVATIISHMLLLKNETKVREVLTFFEDGCTDKNKDEIFKIIKLNPTFSKMGTLIIAAGIKDSELNFQYTRYGFAKSMLMTKQKKYYIIR